MNKNYSTLIEKYPLLFKHEEGSMEPFAMFGFECDIGWYDIINYACVLMYSDYGRVKRELSYHEKCLNEFDSYYSQRKKYNSEIASEEDIKKELEAKIFSHAEKLAIEAAKLPKVVQVKEKFGTLRFYIENSNEVFNAITSYAEYLSGVICETCGNSGQTYHMSWHKTLCPKHAVERYGQDAIDSYSKILN